MKFDYFTYTLRQRGGPSREGALIRVHLEYFGCGYADCHPWPELGDRPLTEHLASIAQDQPTPLARKSLYFALIDAEARASRVPLLSDLPIPLSHSLLARFTDLDVDLLSTLATRGFRRLKLKVGRHPAEEAAHLATLAEPMHAHGLKVRLDFNRQLSRPALEDFLAVIQACDIPAESWIDFLEDPVADDTRAWKWIRSVTSLRLAVDRNPSVSSLHLADICVRKPAIQGGELDDLLRAEPGKALVVTSYLDHPLGQVCAAWEAGKLNERGDYALEDCGLLSHTVYEANEFSECLASNGPTFQPPAGFGFGFDDLLERLNWKEWA